MKEKVKNDRLNKTTTNISLDLSRDEWREFKELLKGKTGIGIGTFFSMVVKQYIRGEIGFELLQNGKLHIAKIINSTPDGTKAIDSKTKAEFRVILDGLIDELKNDGKSLDSEDLRELEMKESIKYALTVEQRMYLYSKLFYMIPADLNRDKRYEILRKLLSLQTCGKVGGFCVIGEEENPKDFDAVI